MNVTDWLIRFEKIHGNKYNYSHFKEYVNIRTKIPIECNIHGIFHQLPDAHERGQGCPKCAAKKSSECQRNSNESFMQSIESKFDGNIIVIGEYESAHKKIRLECKKHSFEFESSPHNLLKSKFGCRLCSKESLSHTTEFFIDKSNKIHNSKYEYPKGYINNKTLTTIICPLHGNFEQIPNSHLLGHGCPKCSKSHSSAELEIADLIESWGLDVIIGDKKILDGQEIDILIPSISMGIEYNGLLWHCEDFGGKSSEYHLDKTKLANDKGYGLIQIFESEWLTKRNIVIAKIKNALKVNNPPNIGARKCVIKKIQSKECNSFLEMYHIQGGDTSPIRYGAFFGDILVGVMTFKRIGGIWNLNRFAVCFEYKVSGLASKIFKVFLNEFNPDSVVTFADRRWTLDCENNLYRKIGFELLSTTPPAYHYFKHNSYTLYNRQHFMKHKIIQKNPNIQRDLTEYQMMLSLGYHRIYDCGHFKFIYTKK